MKILTLQDLKGHDVFEFMVGPYNEEHWKESSIFITEEDFSFLFPSIKDTIHVFNYYGPNSINAEQWDLIKMKLVLTDHSNGRTQFLVDFLGELDKWVKKCLEEQDCFTICGL